jgi:hypothetical protein
VIAACYVAVAPPTTVSARAGTSTPDDAGLAFSAASVAVAVAAAVVGLVRSNAWGTVQLGTGTGTIDWVVGGGLTLAPGLQPCGFLHPLHRHLAEHGTPFRKHTQYLLGTPRSTTAALAAQPGAMGVQAIAHGMSWWCPKG